MNDDELRSAFADLASDLPDDRALPAATARRVARRRSLKLGAGALGGAGVLAAAAVIATGLTAPSDDRLVLPGQQPTASPSQDPTASPTPRPTPSPSTSPSPASTAVPSPGATGPALGTPSEEPATAVTIVLRPDGLGTDGGSSTTSLPFGTDAATVRAVVDRVLLPGGEAPTPDCGAGSSTVQHENLFLQLQDGVFVGWTTGSPGLTTSDGIGVGTSLAELRAALPAVTVVETTLGSEWSTEGGLAGFLDGTDDTSVVNSMAAGVRCLAR